VDGGAGGGDLFDSPAQSSGCSTSGGGGPKGSGAALAGILLGLAAFVRRRARA
jgi:MYXO-CTERM domain-containing protein